MNYSIGEVAGILNTSSSAIRFYDKKGLLPMIKRNTSGIRFFTEKDLTGLRTIEYLRKSGMSIKNIKKFVDWCNVGDESLQDRYDLFLNQREIVQQQISELNETLNVINEKCTYYEEALKNGHEDRSRCPFAVDKNQN